MNTATSTEPRIKDVEVSDDAITACLADGRVISVPLAWSWRLSEASPAQRKNFEIIGSGQGVHWPDIDEDISAQGMLTGVPARKPKKENIRPHIPQEEKTYERARILRHRQSRRGR